MQISDQSPYDTPLIASYLRVYSTLGLKNARMEGSGAGWSSLAARRAHNPKVIGSNPIPATKYLMGLMYFCFRPSFFLHWPMYGLCRELQLLVMPQSLLHWPH
jgi:hypothetical protein